MVAVGSVWEARAADWGNIGVLLAKLDEWGPSIFTQRGVWGSVMAVLGPGSSTA